MTKFFCDLCGKEIGLVEYDTNDASAVLYANGASQGKSSALLCGTCYANSARIFNTLFEAQPMTKAEEMHERR